MRREKERGVEGEWVYFKKVSSQGEKLYPSGKVRDGGIEGLATKMVKNITRALGLEI